MNLSDAAKALEMMERGVYAVPYGNRDDRWGLDWNAGVLPLEVLLKMDTPEDGWTSVLAALAAAYDALYGEKRPGYVVMTTEQARTFEECLIDEYPEGADGCESEGNSHE